MLKINKKKLFYFKLPFHIINQIRKVENKKDYIKLFLPECIFDRNGSLPRLKNNMFLGYEGYPGAGKTLWMLDDMIQSSIVFKRENYTNLKVNLPNFHYFENLDQLIELYYAGKLVNCNIGLDEVGMLAPSRFWKKADENLVKFLMQLSAQHRKDNINIFWTSQNIGDADIKLRNCTKFIWHCEGDLYYDPATPPSKYQVIIRKLYKYNEFGSDNIIDVRRKFIHPYHWLFSIFDTTKKINISDYNKIKKYAKK